ncbi:MAG: alpha/beta fold hydrolase [Proteobacteria bacterium]|uniref:alpha/beta hydrolase n=1 Tax=Aquabacterium sp. TaxID=1872578 RepID=UPI0035C77923|nr:alpha/beta fold hydrolase [Pseudomonadota bacterium]
MNEHILTFGPGNRLVGTLSQPAGQPRATAILLLNAGVIQRMGPHRINVKLARELAQQGFLVLRIDLSGQGDSQASETPLSFEQQAVCDLSAAMDHLQRVTAARQFALAGICSGAHHGIAAAIGDERLKALWLMDTHAYPTPRTLWVRARRQLQLDLAGTVSRWARRLLPLLTSRLRQSARRDEPALLTDNAYPTPSKAEFAQRIQTLIDRQVRLQLVYSGGMFWRYNHASQWRDAFKDHGAVATVACDLLSDVDHTASTLHAQRRLIDSVTRFASNLA